MKSVKEQLLLYAVTDRSWLGEQTLAQQVEATLQGGTTMLQLREKELNQTDFLQEAREIQALCQQYQVPFIVNDDIDVAIACNADGVHVGQHDLAADEVRKKIGADKILGVSAQTVDQAILAEQQGADYLGVGAVFSTSTKQDADAVSFETLQQICQAVSIPVVAIGGISKDNLSQLTGSGIAGIAVVSAIFAQPDIKQATQELLQLTHKMVKQ